MNKMVEVKKSNKPTFRGRFGTRPKRSSSIAKWDKWRVPRGIDIKWKRGDGNRPRIGYGVRSDLKHLHPKGLPEYMIFSLREVVLSPNSYAQEYVFRLSSTLGAKKRATIVAEAKKKGFVILNE